MKLRNKNIHLVMLGLFQAGLFVSLLIAGTGVGLDLGQYAFDNPAKAVAAGEGTATLYLPVISNSPMPPSIFGIDMGSVVPANGLVPLRNAGVSWVRRGNFSWANVEPTKGAREWTAMAGLETEMVNAANSGMRMILVIHRTPDWAQAAPGYSCGPIRDDALPAFANFMRDMVARYSVPPYNVKYWEIWNEQDVALRIHEYYFGCWGVEGDPYFGGENYTRVLQAVYPAIKAADPASQVLIGGLLLDCDPVNPPEWPAGSGQLRDCTPSKYLEGILHAGGGPYFDGVSFHAYDYYGNGLNKYGNVNWHSLYNTTGPATRAKASYLQSVLAAYGYPEKRLFNTEVALLCTSTCDSTFELTKANYLAHAFVDAQALGLQANIWYDALGGWRNSGLLKSDLTPLPAYYAYQFARQLLGQSQFLRMVSDYPGIKVYEFMRSTGKMWFVVSQDGLSHTMDLPSFPDAVWDALGNPQAAENTLQIDLSPRYVEWNP